MYFDGFRKRLVHGDFWEKNVFFLLLLKKVWAKKSILMISQNTVFTKKTKQNKTEQKTNKQTKNKTKPFIYFN